MKAFHLLRSHVLVLEHLKLSTGRYCSQAAALSRDKKASEQLESSQHFVEFPNVSEEYFPRRLPLTVEEYERRKTLAPIQPEDPHLLKVALVGDPNVGKSTLINSLMKWKVCAVSKKVHTTRKKACAMLVHGNKQIVFLDTPGFVSPEHSKRHKLEVSLVVDPKHSAASADLIAVLIDASNKWTNKTINDNILHMLENMKDKISILILNKVDAMKSKKELLRISEILTERTTSKEKESSSNDNEDLLKENKHIFESKVPEVQIPFPPKIFPDPNRVVRHGWPYFSQVFMISALCNDGVDQLREFMFSMTKPAPWMYHSSEVTDQHPYLIVTHIVREKLLDFLPKEIPYGLSVKVSSWIFDPAGVLRIVVVIKCPNSRHKMHNFFKQLFHMMGGKFVIGNSGALITKCVSSSRQAIADAFRCEVFLKIEVK